MKINYAIQPGCSIEHEVKDVKQGFALVAHLQEVFGVKKCQNCGSPNVRLCYRTPQGYEFFSVKCQDCHHELSFGQQRENGRLFPKGWKAPHYKSDDDKPRRAPEPEYYNQDDDDEQETTSRQPAAASQELPF